MDNSNAAVAKASNKLEKRDLIKVWLTWICYGQICYNYERLMGLGFCHAISHAIKKLYTDKDDIAAALTRHMAFYNTENTWGAIIIGIVTAVEEEKAASGNVDDSFINNLKVSLMGPIAGIGDSITQGIVKVILLGIGVGLAQEANAFGPVFYVLAFTAYALIVSGFLFFSGYNTGKTFVIKLLSSNLMKSVTDAMKIVTMMVVGALAATSIKATTALSVTIDESPIIIQDILNKIFPNMLPLAVLGLVFYLYFKKKKSTVYILITLFIIGFVCAFFKILA
ncbi:PTS system mannose/fructose/sorbose family transporter subunit IID [Anaeropeptidivorans aminofermentans]|jgi:mannose/fructose/N-acetylgalactosamine-specific phosphotransferase system component IID|uniref:PTS system mannose/fructose/sorbose family transporter subunit IID n=1 Tax=Anaeropeptidivorans aminofermentans TaxID=2934315 RepID=UPI00202464E1|nr:PTS system mannose/fructose/sorbose family transporter subunit IID [Anaeropeptidivorans aminofermentans]MBE6012019.1 PTS system mannose/fructose/sorbose family transporter subunit IID [Lachnospiraceae bacterium]